MVRRVLFRSLLLALSFQSSLLLAQQDASKPVAKSNITKTVNSSVKLLNQFWGAVFQNSGLGYTPPSDVFSYTTTVETPCGRALQNNAFYCPKNRSIGYDKEFLARIQRKHGTYATYTVIAHEWGHFIAYALNLDHRLSISEELQADCFSGAFIRWFSDQNPGDSAEYVKGAQTLFLMGDEVNTPWFVKIAHGKPEERLRSFFHGYFSGYSACFN